MGWSLPDERTWERKSGSRVNEDLASSVAAFSAARRSAACTVGRNGHDSQIHIGQAARPRFMSPAVLILGFPLRRKVSACINPAATEKWQLDVCRDGIVSPAPATRELRSMGACRGQAAAPGGCRGGDLLGGSLNAVYAVLQLLQYAAGLLQPAQSGGGEDGEERQLADQLRLCTASAPERYQPDVGHVVSDTPADTGVHKRISWRCKERRAQCWAGTVAKVCVRGQQGALLHARMSSHECLAPQQVGSCHLPGRLASRVGAHHAASPCVTWGSCSGITSRATASSTWAACPAPPLAPLKRRRAVLVAHVVKDVHQHCERRPPPPPRPCCPARCSRPTT